MPIAAPPETSVSRHSRYMYISQHLAWKTCRTVSMRRADDAPSKRLLMQRKNTCGTSIQGHDHDAVRTQRSQGTNASRVVSGALSASRLVDSGGNPCREGQPKMLIRSLSAAVRGNCSNQRSPLALNVSSALNTCTRNNKVPVQIESASP
jgi:hypothetical protein